jgi:hypothetical protein
MLTVMAPTLFWLSGPTRFVESAECFRVMVKGLVMPGSHFLMAAHTFA